jgi:DNA-binding transcriptional ArsR family regulator
MTNTDDPSERVFVDLDTKGLKVLAHPVRIKLLGLLRKHGPSTATRLAARLELASGATSYHLRQLAGAGFVTEDTARGNNRDRWWRAAHDITRFRSSKLLEGDPAAAMVYLQAIASLYTEAMQRYLAGEQTMPQEWREVGQFSDGLLRLTVEETRELSAELDAVISKYRREDPEAVDRGPAGGKRVKVQVQVMPEADDDEADDEADGADDGADEA